MLPPLGSGISQETYTSGREWALQYVDAQGYLVDTLQEHIVRLRDHDEYRHVTNTRYAEMMMDARKSWSQRNAGEVGQIYAVFAEYHSRFYWPTEEPDVLLIAHNIKSCDSKWLEMQGVVLSYKHRRVLADCLVRLRAWDTASGKPGRYTKKQIDACLNSMQQPKARL